MGVDNMRTSLEETRGLLKAVQAGVTYINCDAAADKQQSVTSVKGIDLHGGGGTDMRVGIKAALASYPSPDVIILFTDGYTPWPEHRLPKGMQLVVCLVGQSACEVNDVPPWCKVVKIVDEIVDTRQAGF
jgi:predicted metal-dependent peptidase